MGDFKFAFRQLTKSPGFTAMAVLTLALGIGATTAIFSLVNAVLLRTLPYPEADRLTVVWATNPDAKSSFPLLPPSNADVTGWREQTGGGNGSFSGIAAFNPRTADIVDGGDPERVGAAGVTAGFFETLGVTPLLGRTLETKEESFGGPPVAMISHRLWQRRFGGDLALVGRSVSINGDHRVIIGILPSGFDFPRAAEWPSFFPFSASTDVWLPLGFRARDDKSGQSSWDSQNERGLVVFGRLKPDTTSGRAQAEMDVFAARQIENHPEIPKGMGLKLVSLRRQLAGKSYGTLMTLFAAVGLLLLIACVNVANLLLVRGVARRHEMAVRVALGARRGRLIRQLLAEGCLLAVFGGGLGLLVASACLKVFPILNPVTHSRLDEASLDPAVIGFTALVTLATSLVFGLVPALRMSGSDLRGALHESGRGGEGVVGARLRGWLVGAESALALVLLMTAGLMVRSLLEVRAVQTGFRTDSVLAFDLQLPKSRYPDPAAVRFFEQLTARLEKLPGVHAAGAISYLPLGGGENMGNFAVEGEPPAKPGTEPLTQRRWVTPGYFATMGVTLRRGRVFDSTDSAENSRTVVINETMAKRFFSAVEPVGRRLVVSGAPRTVVGVVSDVRSGGLESEVPPQVYLPHAQDPWPPMTVVMHTGENPLALASAARAELRVLDGFLPAAKMRTMDQVVSDATDARRFNVALLIFFAGSALLLTAMGIYGVVAFLAGSRRREIGIRMALGAQRRDVLQLVLGQGIKPVAMGAVAGLAASFMSARLVASQLYGISTTDPLTLGGVIAVLAATALLACWLPARRAARVNPIAALRNE